MCLNETKITVFLTWDALIHEHLTRTHTHKAMPFAKQMNFFFHNWKPSAKTQHYQRTMYYSLFSGNWHNISRFFCYYSTSFSHRRCRYHCHCAFMTKPSTTNDVLFTLTSSNIPTLTILTFDGFFLLSFPLFSLSLH